MTKRASFIVGVVALASVLAACSMSRKPSSVMADATTTSSSVSAPKYDGGIVAGDADIIQSVVAGTTGTDNANNELAWQNPASGNEGSVKVIDNFVGQNGQKCKKFQTTADTFMGISMYDGETCELKKGYWAISWMKQKMAN